MDAGARRVACIWCTQFKITNIRVFDILRSVTQIRYVDAFSTLKYGEAQSVNPPMSSLAGSPQVDKRMPAGLPTP